MSIRKEVRGRMRYLRSQRGQTFTEFTIMAAMVLSLVFALVLFLATFTEYGSRILNLIGLELP